MLVVGCDPSAKKIALVVIDTVLNVQRVFVYSLYKTGTQNPVALGKALFDMRDFLGQIAPMTSGSDNTAWVETPFVGQRKGAGVTAGSAIKQGYVRGIVVGALVDAGFNVYDLHQSTWKAWFGVTGKTKEAKANASRILGVQHPKLFRLVEGDVDLTDAAAIALYGAEQARKAHSLDHAGLAGSTVQRRRSR